MKAKVITIVFLSLIFSAIAQDNKLKLNNINIGFGGFSIKNNQAEGGGALILAELTTSYNKNLVAISYLTGTEIGIIGKSNYKFDEIRLLYGRELKLKKWFAFETFAGIGFYNQNSQDSYIITGNSISFPLKLNSKFYFKKQFGIGLNINYSINKLNNNFSSNIIFHYKFH